MLQSDSLDLARRYWSYSNDGSKYAFFAFLAAIIIIFLIFTCMLNVRRIRRGRTPIISQYLAPPSYYQSQHQSPDANTVPLPAYTEQPNPNQDIGYYDNNGNFIPYSKANGAGGPSVPPGPNGPGEVNGDNQTAPNPFDQQGTGHTSPPYAQAPATEPISSPQQAYSRPDDTETYPAYTSHSSSANAPANYTPPPGPPPTHKKDY
ncbi:hypothetical protein KL949_000574 [Ogataea haglerorum]|nr:hypothetical protein KL913_000192 [Ogataea haglerorum]KAG7723524.1 hypothetical protein KL949_000574 [Ogataea haglerorum]KAG7771852.1 hypothetical protein KL931_000192 [Ogataea haglerorum]